MPYLNPARALGPSFVLKKWDNNLIYWCIPFIASILSGLIQNIFVKSNTDKNSNGANENISIQSEDYEIELNKQSPQNHNFQNGQIIQQLKYNQNVYSHAPSGKLDTQEPLYSGTKSLYSRSPPMARSNLNRSQSVYTKSNTAINRDLPRQGPLVPAQSLHFRTNQSSQNTQSHMQNQNVQNQINQHAEIYSRNSMRLPLANGQNVDQAQELRMQQIYGTTNFEAVNLDTRADINRPESMYGTTQKNRGQSVSAQSDDSCYSSSCQSPQITPPTRDHQQQQQQQQHMIRYVSASGNNNSNQIRTQSERKISGTPVISANQQINMHSQQLPSMTMQNERQQYNSHSVYGTVPTIRN